VSSRTRKILKALGATAGALTGVGAGCLTYAALYEVNDFRLRRIAVRVLPPGADPIRALHISDLHMVPAARARQRWLSGLADLKPDLVINTGDNLAHRDAVPYVVASLGELLGLRASTQLDEGGRPTGVLLRAHQGNNSDLSVNVYAKADTLEGCVAKFGSGGERASNTARPGSHHAAVWNRPAMKPAWALMSRPPMFRTCPFLIIAIAS